MAGCVARRAIKLFITNIYYLFVIYYFIILKPANFLDPRITDIGVIRVRRSGQGLTGGPVPFTDIP
jgi:hypothetical protein